MSSENQTTRLRILTATLDLLQGGSKSVRMSDIARTAGISRQALYLHFSTRAELLIAAARHLDEVNEVDARLEPSRTAETGRARLKSWVESWGNYIPEIWGLGEALAAMQHTDADAAEALADRMRAVRDGCAAAVAALHRDGDLTPDLSATEATDLLWTMLSVGSWRQLRFDCGWSQADYVARMTLAAEKALIRAP
ncbi:TetR/AcrR family transcriptional regulator [Chachezhania antarctica]|uniref:TetR/AcrR family transcriptional regulator n=1 Tax=Chachezhania antarctica TaxID=2340860 RepID=UPI000EAE4BE5|nr:TetR/AcrR family transcriptional regulator [Chachezhania antarctica]